LSAGGDLSAGRSFNRETFYGTGDILIKGRYIKSVIIFPRADFSWRRHFNVTPVQLHG